MFLFAVVAVADNCYSSALRQRRGPLETRRLLKLRDLQGRLQEIQDTADREAFHMLSYLIEMARHEVADLLKDRPKTSAQRGARE